MKSRRKLMYILKIVFVILILLLLIVLLFLYKAIINKNNKDKVHKKYQTITKEYIINLNNDLEFDFKNYEVVYALTDKKHLIVKQSSKTDKMLIDKVQYNNKVVIKESVSNIFEKKKYKVFIPKLYNNKIKIKNGFGNIKIKGIKDLFLDNNSGNVEIDNSSLLNVKTVSGNIKIKDNIDYIKGDSSTGDFNIELLNGYCDIETITGDINIKKMNVLSNSIIETTSGNINIIVDKKSDCNFMYKESENNKITNKKCLNGKNQLKIENVTGNIIIK